MSERRIESTTTPLKFVSVVDKGEQVLLGFTKILVNQKGRKPFSIAVGVSDENLLEKFLKEVVIGEEVEVSLTTDLLSESYSTRLVGYRR